MPRITVETSFQFEGKTFTMYLRDKIIPEDVIMNLAKHYAATLKSGKAPSRKETDQNTKMALVRLNLEI